MSSANWFCRPFHPQTPYGVRTSQDCAVINDSSSGTQLQSVIPSRWSGSTSFRSHHPRCHAPLRCRGALRQRVDTRWDALPLISALRLPHSMPLPPRSGSRLRVPSVAFRSPPWSASSDVVSQPVLRSATRTGLFTLPLVGLTSAPASARANPLPPNVGAGCTVTEEAI